jgi:Zn finger protein HypA/HybF involved in hydrogenase expression
MIKQNDAVKLADGSIQPEHTVEIYCPNCGRDVDESELAAQKCNDCNTSLAKPKQSVSITVTTKPMGTKLWGQ